MGLNTHVLDSGLRSVQIPTHINASGVTAYAGIEETGAIHSVCSVFSTQRGIDGTLVRNRSFGVSGSVIQRDEIAAGCGVPDAGF